MPSVGRDDAQTEARHRVPPRTRTRAVAVSSGHGRRDDALARPSRAGGVAPRGRALGQRRDARRFVSLPRAVEARRRRGLARGRASRLRRALRGRVARQARAQEGVAPLRERAGAQPPRPARGRTERGGDPDADGHPATGHARSRRLARGAGRPRDARRRRGARDAPPGDAGDALGGRELGRGSGRGAPGRVLHEVQDGQVFRRAPGVAIRACRAGDHPRARADAPRDPRAGGGIQAHRLRPRLRGVLQGVPADQPVRGGGGGGTRRRRRRARRAARRRNRKRGGRVRVERAETSHAGARRARLRGRRDRRAFRLRRSPRPSRGRASSPRARAAAAAGDDAAAADAFSAGGARPTPARRRARTSSPSLAPPRGRGRGR